MFERLTNESRAVLRRGRAEARTSGHRVFGSEHVLLALASTPGAPSSALARMGISAPRVQTQIQSMHEASLDRNARGPIPLSEEGRQVLQSADALTDGREAIEPGHLLLAVVTQSDSNGARVLAQLGADKYRIASFLSQAESDAESVSDE